MTPENDVAAWAKDHKACFETDPLIELRGTEKIQVGFTLALFAALPLAMGPGEERRQAGSEIWQRLRTILVSALGEETGQAHTEIEPMKTAAVLRRETDMQPEVTLRARIVHVEDVFKAATADDRQRLSDFEKKLAAMGLKAGHW